MKIHHVCNNYLETVFYVKKNKIIILALILIIFQNVDQRISLLIFQIVKLLKNWVIMKKMILNVPNVKKDIS